MALSEGYLPFSGRMPASRATAFLSPIRSGFAKTEFVRQKFVFASVYEHSLRDISGYLFGTARRERGAYDSAPAMPRDHRFLGSESNAKQIDQRLGVVDVSRDGKTLSFYIGSITLARAALIPTDHRIFVGKSRLVGENEMSVAHTRSSVNKQYDGRSLSARPDTYVLTIAVHNDGLASVYRVIFHIYSPTDDMSVSSTASIFHLFGLWRVYKSSLCKHERYLGQRRQIRYRIAFQHQDIRAFALCDGTRYAFDTEYPSVSERCDAQSLSGRYAHEARKIYDLRHISYCVQ